MRTLLLLAACLIAAALPLAARDMEIYFIDVEGGQSTLFVSPSGQSLLVDAGWPGHAYRDADRIVKAAKMAGVKKIDYLLITHYHVDHVGGVPQLASKLHIGTYIDHGPNREDSNSTRVGYADYLKAIDGSNHMVVKPGDHLPIKGFEAVVVSADGNLIQQPLPGAGQPNPACSSTPRKEPDSSENARSTGIVITYAGVRIVDLGDLTWNKELELVCPVNKIGKVDIDVVSHHGLELSNSPALLDALSPRVAVMDNGAKKGGAPAAWDVVDHAPGLQQLWQLHFADAGGKQHNVPDAYIANVTEADTGYPIQIVIRKDGHFTVTNLRNRFSREYAAR